VDVSDKTETAAICALRPLRRLLPRSAIESRRNFSGVHFVQFNSSGEDQSPAEGHTPSVTVPMSAEEIAVLDAWIEAQPFPRPSRPEAVRRILTQALVRPVEGPRQSDASLDQQITQQEASIAGMRKPAGPSPEAAMAVMDKALAENGLVDLKNRRIRRKNSKRGR
jgi:hypothetical protein